MNLSLKFLRWNPLRFRGFTPTTFRTLLPTARISNVPFVSITSLKTHRPHPSCVNLALPPFTWSKTALKHFPSRNFGIFSLPTRALCTENKGFVLIDQEFQKKQKTSNTSKSTSTGFVMLAEDQNKQLATGDKQNQGLFSKVKEVVSRTVEGLFEENVEHIPDPGIRTGYSLSYHLLKDTLTPAEQTTMSLISPEDVLVVKGTFDHVETVFTELAIPHTVLTERKFLTTPLSSKQTVYVNCSRSHSEEFIKKIREFVESGGMLVSSDWALNTVLEPAFPNTVMWNRKKTSAYDALPYPIEIVDRLDEVMKGFLLEEKIMNSPPIWWVDKSAYPIRVLDHSRVNVLMKSEGLRYQYGESPIFVTFKHGRGTVYHMISHFFLLGHMQSTLDAADYARLRGASDTTLTLFDEAKTGVNSTLNFDTMRSCMNSVELYTRLLMKHKQEVGDY